VSGNQVWYQVHPYRFANGVRTYAGVSLDKSFAITLATAAVTWPMWLATPDWVTGFVVVRWVNWGTYDYRDLSLAAMVVVGPTTARAGQRKHAARGLQYAADGGEGHVESAGYNQPDVMPPCSVRWAAKRLTRRSDMC